MSSRPLTHTRTNLPDLAPTSERPVRIAARDLEASELLAAHLHTWNQITYALDGVVRVTVGNSTWIVPPMRAIWIPADTVHEVVMLDKVRLRSVFIHASVTPFKPDQCQVIDVSPLLRELIVALAQAEIGGPREAMLSSLLIDEISRSATLAIHVALPSDKRLKSLCQTLITNPAAALTLEEWSSQVGASARTLARLFERELGMSFSQWRQQVRLAHAAPLIASGMPLSRVAAELGYASQSAFSAMFKKTFGQSPSSFFDRRKT